MDQSEAEQIYLYQVMRAEEQIKALGNNSQAINAFITNTYAAMSKENSTFLWFSLGGIVSSTVGKNIQVATQTIINSVNQEPSSKVVLEAFSKGNQDVFKDVLPIFLTYKLIGIDGVRLLTTSNIDNPFKNPILFKAVENFCILQSEQSKLANSLGLSINDPKVIEKLFSDQTNIARAHSVAMGTTNNEQLVLQNIYKDDLIEIIKDPTLGWIGGKFKLDEINILGKSFKFSDYIENPADFGQRMAFAEVLLNEMEEGIKNGQFEQIQAYVQQMAEHTLWMANPHVAHDKIDGVNGIYWGEQAQEYDQNLKNMVSSYLNPASIFSGEHEIVKINMDPLSLFLANNPNYEVIAHNINELWASNNYLRTPINGGTIFWNPNIPYLKDSTYLALYTDGEYHYYQPHGEVRGITFPFIYDKTTGKPLTMPIVDAWGHYDHVSTLDTIYNHPEEFNKPSHINWYNPYWDQLAQQAQQTAINHYLQSISVDNFMNNVLAPTTPSISYYNSNVQLELKGTDMFHNGANHIDFSSLSATGQGGSSAIVSMVLANGTTFEVDTSGNFVCMNCGTNGAILEQAANAMLHQVM